MKKRYKIIIGVVLALAVCGYLGMQYLSPLTVEGEAVAAAPLSDSFTAQGRVVPASSVILNSPATGTVHDFPFKPGMTVETGQQLIDVNAANPAELAIQKEQLRQQLAAAEHQYQQLFSERGMAQQQAAVEAANSAYQLAQQQYQAALQVEQGISGVYTEGQLSELANAVKSAKHAVTAAEAQGGTAADREYFRTLIASTRAALTALEEDEQSEPLLAPFSGVVWEVFTDQGSYIIKNQPVLKLYQQELMKVEVSLLSEDSLNIQLGDMAELRLFGGRQFPARVSFISPVAEQTVSSLGLVENRCTVELEPDNLPATLGAGHQLDVIFTNVLAENALSVPASSIVPLGNGGSAVYVAEGGKARLVPVQTGVKSGGRVEIAGGLSAGDFVIADPYDAGIKEGSRVSYATSP